MRAPAAAPLEPSPGEARRWLLHELAKPQYQAAKPSWFDVLSRRVLDWLESLLPHGSGPGGTTWLAIAGTVVVLGLVAVAFLVYGAPRRDRRGRLRAPLGVDPRATAAQLRAAGERAATRGDWPLAVTERFRAIAAELAERTVVAVLPGTTAHEVGALAGRAFPEAAEGLRRAADSFDRVRYLDLPASAADYDRLRDLDELLHRSRPLLDPAAELAEVR